MMRMLLLIVMAPMAVFAEDPKRQSSDPPSAVLRSYSWTEILADSVAAGRVPVSIEGKTDGSGLTGISVMLTNRTIEGYLKGNKAYVTCTQRNWHLEPLLNKGESPGVLMTRLIRGVTPPSQEIDFLFSNGDRLQRDGDTLSGELPDAAAKRLLESSTKETRRADPNNRREAKAARGNVTLWTRDGQVTKYEVRLTGKIDVDGKETEVVRTRTIEIKDVGRTSIDLPEAARRKLFGE